MNLEELLVLYNQIAVSSEVSEGEAKILGYFEMCSELERERNKRGDVQFF